MIVRKIQLSWEDVYAILETSYAESYNTKVVDNEVLYHLIDFENFWMFGLMYMKKRRDSAVVTIGSETVDAWTAGLGTL